MVLELKVPHGAGLHDLAAVTPVFLSYVMSFIYIGIYWNNHHHFWHLVRRIDGLVLWANLHLLFWLALVPTALYRISLLVPAFAWLGLQYAIIRSQGPESALAHAIGRDLKGKLSPLFYLLGVPFAFVDARIAGTLYVSVALRWLIPDRRIERAFRRS